MHPMVLIFLVVLCSAGLCVFMIAVHILIRKCQEEKELIKLKNIEEWKRNNAGTAPVAYPVAYPVDYPAAHPVTHPVAYPAHLVHPVAHPGPAREFRISIGASQRV